MGCCTWPERRSSQHTQQLEPWTAGRLLPAGMQRVLLVARLLRMHSHVFAGQSLTTWALLHAHTLPCPMQLWCQHHVRLPLLCLCSVARSLQSSLSLFVAVPARLPVCAHFSRLLPDLRAVWRAACGSAAHLAAAGEGGPRREGTPSAAAAQCQLCAAQTSVQPGINRYTSVCNVPSYLNIPTSLLIACAAYQHAHTSRHRLFVCILAGAVW